MKICTIHESHYFSTRDYAPSESSLMLVIHSFTICSNMSPKWKVLYVARFGNSGYKNIRLRANVSLIFLQSKQRQ